MVGLGLLSNLKLTTLVDLRASNAHAAKLTPQKVPVEFVGQAHSGVVGWKGGGSMGGNVGEPPGE